MSNPFDLGYLPEYELGGIGSKLKKAVKKTVKTVKSVAKKVDQTARAIEKKIVPPKLLAVQKKVRNNKIVQGAAIAVASVYAGPVVAAALKGGAVKAISGKAILSAAAKGAAKVAVKEGVVKAVNKKVSSKQKAALAAASAQAAAQVNELRRSPEFEKIYTSLKAAGKTDNEVLDTWVNSDTFKAVASKNAAATILPGIEQQYTSAGAPPSVAHQMAAQDAQAIATQAADNVGGLSLGKVALFAIPVMFALMGG
jgi:hypothetical protein